MRAFSYAWSLPITWRRWQSHHSIRRIRKPHVARKVYAYVTLFIESELLSIEVLHCRNMNFRLFLLLWPWPWLDNLHIRTWPVFPRDKPDVQIWTCYVNKFMLSKVIVWHTDIENRQTERQTDRLRSKLGLHTASFRGGGDKNSLCWKRLIATKAWQFDRLDFTRQSAESGWSVLPPGECEYNNMTFQPCFVSLRTAYSATVTRLIGHDHA